MPPPLHPAIDAATATFAVAQRGALPIPRYLEQM
jgi:hypothetical protein